MSRTKRPLGILEALCHRLKEDFGVSGSSIAVEIQLSASTVNRYLQRYALELKRRAPGAKRLYEELKSLDEQALWNVLHVIYGNR